MAPAALLPRPAIGGDALADTVAPLDALEQDAPLVDPRVALIVQRGGAKEAVHSGRQAKMCTMR